MQVSGDPAVSVRAERQKGFVKGLNVAFALLALFSLAFTALHTFASVPRFCDIFKQVNVPVPFLTLIVLNYYGVALFALALANLTCLGISLKWRDRWAAAIPTVACFSLTLMWLAMVVIGLFMPMMSLLEGIKGR